MCTYESSDSKLNRLRNGKFDFHFLRKTKEEADLDFFSHLLKTPIIGRNLKPRLYSVFISDESFGMKIYGNHLETRKKLTSNPTR